MLVYKSYNISRPIVSKKYRVEFGAERLTITVIVFNSFCILLSIGQIQYFF